MLSTNQRQYYRTLLGLSIPVLLLLLAALLTTKTTTTLAQEPTPTATPSATQPTNVAPKPTLPRIQLVFLTPTATPTSTETLEPPSPTATATATATPEPPSPTATATPEPPSPTATATPEPPSPTSTSISTPTPQEEAAEPAQPESPTAPAPEPEPQPESHLPEQMRAFWAASFNEGYRNPGEADELIANMVRANANTLIVQMRRHGDSWYTRSVEPRAADPGLAPAAEYDALDYLIQKGHEHGIKVHAWLVVTVTCRDHDDLRGHPDHICTTHGPYIEGTESWTTLTYEGEPVGDLDFGHPSAIHHMESVVTHLVQNYPDLDGIHYDFIRYSGKSFGYNPVSVDRYNRAHNLPPDHWPPPDEPAWEQWRRDRMTELVRRLYIRSKAINPKIEMSIAAITWGGSGNYDLASFRHSAAYARLFQDWQSWLQEGIIDFAVPMHYFEEGRENNRTWLDGWLAWDHQNVGQRAIVPGLGSWLNTPEQNIAQVQRSLAPNAEGYTLSGVAFYAYHNLFVGCDPQRRREFMDMLRHTVFTEPARAPVWDWIANPTTGMLQGMATIDGVSIPDAKVMLVKDGVWIRDITASVDGWYGTINLEPGMYTLIVRDPATGNEATYGPVEVVAGYVAHGS